MNRDIDVLLTNINNQIMKNMETQADIITKSVIEDLGSGTMTTEQAAFLIRSTAPVLVSYSVQLTLKILDGLDVLPPIDSNQARKDFLTLL